MAAPQAARRSPNTAQERPFHRVPSIGTSAGAALATQRDDSGYETVALRPFDTGGPAEQSQGDMAPKMVHVARIVMVWASKPNPVASGQGRESLLLTRTA